MAIHIAAFFLSSLGVGSLPVGLMLIPFTRLSIFATRPAISVYIVQQASGSAHLAHSLYASIIQAGLAAGAGMGGILAETASGVRYHPLLAGGMIAIGIGAAMISFAHRANPAVRTNN